eukprot:TRINITY_DN34122_c0_g1_i1.p1 TRINITY_DN34122_c0_g1~~TRINITY_DN34122_c0_g1_i1.p1  ORF type:complete len:272 (+),score=23.30 TRINITY_DN34122_c0_g1_i1:67-882(+)
MALRRTVVVNGVSALGARKGQERVDFPKVYLNKTEKYTPQTAYNRFFGNRPHILYGHSITSEKYVDQIGHMIYPMQTTKWPKYLVQRGKHGWTAYGNSEAYTTYRTLMEKRYETGELAPSLGERRPEMIMQTWFGKRVQQRRTLTWAEKISKHRIFPHVYGWSQDAAPKAIYSELLNHQFTPAIEHDALTLMESYGGLDQWILQNDPMFLTSWEMEKIRNFLLVRRMEIDKNHVMDAQAESLAEHLYTLVKSKYEREKLEANDGVKESIQE